MKHTITSIRTFLTLLAVLAFATSCTKSRKAELPEDVQSDVLAISEFSGTFKANRESIEPSSTSNSMKAVEQLQNARLSSDEVNVPSRLKFMFTNLPVSAQTSKEFDIKFLVDSEYITAFKVVSNIRELTVLESSLAMTLQEVELIQKSMRASKAETKAISQSLISSEAERKLIKAGQKDGSLLVPIFKYKIEEYGVLARTKNEMKEETAVLKLARTEFKDATHIKIKSLGDGRLPIGGKVQELEELFVESKIDNVLTTAEDLAARLKIGMAFVEGKAQVFTRLDDNVMHIYEVTNISRLNENQLRLLKNHAGNQEVIRCDAEEVAQFIKSEDKNCVLLLKADVPVTYKTVELAKASDDGIAKEDFKQEDVPRFASVGLVSIKKNTPAKQVDISGALDPNSAVKIADLKGEFFYRRTFESASNMFLGRTGTSGDMSIVEFELEDKRIVVRNRESLIKYTGQGAKDREEIMSFPVRYIRMNKISASGTVLTIPVAEDTTKEKAEYAIIDWTQNKVPNASSPLAFYADGSCFKAESSLQVTDTDMRLATHGILNFSLSGSYTMEPRTECIAMKDVNSAYWSGMFQFNYNIAERISFKRHTNKDTDKQFAMNISSMAQEAFNFGTFGLADKVTENGTVTNKDGSEKYMPIIHDFRNGKVLKYYLGGLNTDATDSERRELLIDAAKQVVDEWNATLSIAFRGTSLARDGKYLELVVDDGSKEPIGHLGDLDRNYIWFQELPAENGLLGVAQPAGNPRSGVIEAANVIVYTGNTLDQSVRMLKATAKGRAYEKILEEARQEAIALAKKQKEELENKEVGDPVSAGSETAKAAAAAAVGSGQADKKAVEKARVTAAKIAKNLKQSVLALRLDSAAMKSAISGNKVEKLPSDLKRRATKELYKSTAKGEEIKYEVNQRMFIKRLTALAMDRSLIQNRHQFELAVNNAFLQFGGLDERAKSVLQKRSEQLAVAARFDASNRHRPGCFMYERNDANDEALMMDEDPKKNLMLNFKKNVMTTLSHELGHAFGLLHNFTASTDKANFEFPGESAGRNYSSIMDYIADIDQTYKGPGPYDAHAVRAAYTGMVEVQEWAAEKLKEAGQKIGEGNLVSMDILAAALGHQSLVHLTKDSINKIGALKHFAQCSDGGVGLNAMCAQFDVGGSAVEIVKNKIADYHRGYMNRNYVYDSILFNWTQKVEAINRNIRLFGELHSFMNEAIMSDFFGTGRTEAEGQVIVKDQVEAAKLGYQFFHELLRIPDASGISANNVGERIQAVGYKFVPTAQEQTEGRDCQKNKVGTLECIDYKVLENRSVYDKMIDRDKIDTIGIGYDKAFAMQFLTQASQSQLTDDSQISMISYLDFEQIYLGVTEPAESTTIATILQTLTNQLPIGFFAPNGRLVSGQQTVEVNRFLADQTAVASVISLNETAFRGFDAFASSFKVGSALSKLAPKDRLNVAKAGQDREKSDTRVMFATQNSVGADLIVKTASRTEVFFTNKEALSKLMTELFTADQEVMKAVMPLVQATMAKACAVDAEGKPLDEKACAAAQALTLEDYIKANPAVAKTKQAADRVATKLVNKLRDMNAKEAIMPKEVDKPESAANFQRQVEVVRGMLSQQLSAISEILSVLGQTPKDKWEATVEAVVGQLQQIRQENAKLETLPLFKFAHMFMTETVKELKVTLLFDGNEDGENDVVSGAVLANMMMNGRKLKADHDQILEVLEKLSLFTGFVDPDTVMK